MTTPPALEEVSDADVKRAMATISQALMADSVSLYLAAPGSEDSFHHAVMHSYLQSGQRQRFFHAADFGHGALERLGHQPHLERLAEEHGGALCVHFVGVHPERQGRGLGAALLRHLCALADAAAKHLYLEASTPRSAALYARHGFVGVADKPLGGPGEEGAPVLRVMVRPPSSVAVSSA
ncbi:GNAT family N-acetyltransferase isoform B [Micractinium conductrix]|uniref:GNAT family N-acetyltransferase isoform B n=1 Tax=Micractinium conductrix TaxID=554055 RepID=A0A2P6V5R4_9CHLO|nr:GNAT family N-acetyltransferase isoform B [Micractinium conductrix]|eukprot:PSC69431.1 GNAT family N-acetyltransferase isoform B [Micractinium conductrix]